MVNSLINHHSVANEDETQKAMEIQKPFAWNQHLLLPASIYDGSVEHVCCWLETGAKQWQQ